MAEDFCSAVSASRLPARGLRPAEQDAVLLVYTKSFQDRSPAVFITLLDEASITSIRTKMYRLLDENGEFARPRSVSIRPTRTRAAATAPSIVELGYNKLLGPGEMDLILLVASFRCFQRYVTVDGRLSRKRELAKGPDEESCKNKHPARATHPACRRGTSMRSKR